MWGVERLRGRSGGDGGGGAAQPALGLVLLDGHCLAGERRLGDEEIAGFKKAEIGGDQVAGRQSHRVAGHQVPGGDVGGEMVERIGMAVDRTSCRRDSAWTTDSISSQKRSPTLRTIIRIITVTAFRPPVARETRARRVSTPLKGWRQAEPSAAGQPGGR